MGNKTEGKKIPAAVHEDFGEKIGGARKDLWKGRGLYADDLSIMNDREAEKYVRKDNIWKKPDYAGMRDEGIPLCVVYFIKKVRDAVIASPKYYSKDDTREKRLARQKEYIRTVRELQAAVADVRTAEDAAQACDCFMVGNGYLKRNHEWIGRNDYSATEKGRENPAITNKLLKALKVSSVSAFEREFTQKAEKEQFLVQKKKKAPAGYSIRFHNSETPYSRKTGAYYVMKGRSILRANFATQEEALKWAQDFAKKHRKGGKTRFVPPQLAHVRRTGPDYRKGAEITGQQYLDVFGFRGGEFGNWMSQSDRQASLNMGFEALKDLAAVIKVSDQDISCQGTLAIAFGARGSGKAAAHYEPLCKVINLTKMHGAGSLAHEWWHGLDDYLGEKMGAGGMLSEQPRLYAPFQKLLDTIKFKQETLQIGRVETDFYRNSMRMGEECEKDGGYWDSNTEMTARAFACYVKDRLPYLSDYLAGHADCALTFVTDKNGKTNILKAFPEGKEREAINTAFDALMEDLKQKGILRSCKKQEGLR